MRAMTEFLTHGRIVGGLATTPDLDGALYDYRDALGLELVERGPVPADLAASWGAPRVAGAAMATLRPTSGAPCFLRLVEQPLPPDYRPTRTFGWNAFEITVQDVFGWPDRLAGSGFEIVGPPKEIEGLPYFVAMQMLGRGREMVYLNEVRSNTPGSDLPKAQSPVDHIFIVILATADREATMRWYQDRLGLDAGGVYTIEYTMINKAFDLAPGTQSTISMLQKGRLPIVEVDGYPAAAAPREVAPGMLPPGNAMVTLAVDSLDRDLPFIAAPEVRDGAFYAGRRTATVRGPAGELLELVELQTRK
jgi:catechol 2,3-dioxygenase-like lactoylglutathione lyase family enzyme